MSITRSALLPLLFLALAACTGEPVQPVEEPEPPVQVSIHLREYPVSPERLCAVARDVLLKRAYVVIRAANDEPRALVGNLEFPAGEERLSVLQVHAVCRARPAGASLFLMAFQGEFDLRQGRPSLSSGAGFVAPITLTASTVPEDQVTTSGIPLEERELYDQLFAAVASELGLPWP